MQSNREATAMPAPSAVKPQGCTSYKLRQLMRGVAQRYDLELGKAGLKATQYALLSHILKLGPVRPGELARAMKMDASTLTRNLRPLLAAGWVELGAGPDQRSRSVRATPAGAAKRREAQHHWKKAQESLNELLGAGRVAALHALLDESIALLEQPEPAA
jgi:DNA-binding MarR family transcriptional regulator